VGIGLSALAVNVALCLVLIPPLGLQGAALALIGSELMQSVLLFGGARQPDRAGLGRSMGIAMRGAAGLLMLGFAVQGSMVAAAVFGVCSCTAVVLFVTRRASRGDPLRPAALLKTR
jgi:O-antigen/teichoic acid export membrane protein